MDPLVLRDPIPQAVRWNRYTYAMDNPLKFVDPNGEDGVAIFGSAFAAKTAGGKIEVGLAFTSSGEVGLLLTLGPGIGLGAGAGINLEFFTQDSLAELAGLGVESDADFLVVGLGIDTPMLGGENGVEPVAARKGDFALDLGFGPGLGGLLSTTATATGTLFDFMTPTEFKVEVLRFVSEQMRRQIRPPEPTEEEEGR